MRTENLLLSFLSVLLQLSLSYADDCDLPDAYIDNVTVIEKTSGSITVRLRLGYCLPYQLKGTMVYYSVEPPTIVPATMSYEVSSRSYKLKPPHASFERNSFGHLEKLLSPSTPGEETFRIYPLYSPDSNYEIKIVSFRTDRSIKTEVLNEITRPVMPRDPPKTGMGCFQVDNVENSFDVNKNSQNRGAWVYWQKVYEPRTSFNLTVYEEHDGGESNELFTRSGRLSSDSIHLDLSFNRHRIVLQSNNNENGYSSLKSVVVIPARQDVLPKLWATYYEDMKNDTILIGWRMPQNVSVTTYTLAWCDTKVDESGHLQLYIKDFVELDKWTNMVEVRRPELGEKVLWGVSVNTKTGSSGLNIIRFQEHNIMNKEQFMREIDIVSSM